MSNPMNVFLENMKFKIKYKLFISISDLVRAKESQKVIDKLMEKYDDNKAPDADMIRVTPFTNGYLRGINISIRYIGKDEAEKYKREFNIVYRRLTREFERKPIKCISLIDIGHLQILKF